MESLTVTHKDANQKGDVTVDVYDDHVDLNCLVEMENVRDLSLEFFWIKSSPPFDPVIRHLQPPSLQKISLWAAAPLEDEGEGERSSAALEPVEELWEWLAQAVLPRARSAKFPFGLN